MTNEPLITWPDPLLELLGFVFFFLAAGAVGFRVAVWPRIAPSGDPGESAFARSASRRAAVLGLIGIAGVAFFSFQDIAGSAAEKSLSIPAFLASQPSTMLEVVLIPAVILGFGLAAGGAGFGWILATLALVMLPLRAAFFGQLLRVVTPVHELAGGLWIGTLFHMVVNGIAPALRSPLPPERRGAMVQRMVNGFSPLALSAFGLLAVMGVITAWRHLKRLDALWTTPYGWALCAKLVVVAGVLALGAWNWRRQKPQLGTEAGAVALRRSATWELVVASVVLVITSILVSLPSPR